MPLLTSPLRWKDDPLRGAAIAEKCAYITNTAHRATTFQYVYPALGKMSECQYDLCKRDFCLDIVESWAKESREPGSFQVGGLSLAELCWYSLWLANSMVSNDEKFEGRLPWRHCEVVENYAHSKVILDAVEALAAVQEVNDMKLERGHIHLPSINGAIEAGMYGFLSPDSLAGARRFKQSGDQIHPDMVGYSSRKVEFDQVLESFKPP